MLTLSSVLLSFALSNPAFFPPSLLGDEEEALARRCELSAGVAGTTRVSRGADCSVLAPHWVLTRASDLPVGRSRSARLAIRVGAAEYGVARLVYHPQWARMPDHDLALLELSRPLSPSANFGAVAADPPEPARQPIVPGRSDRRWIASVILAHRDVAVPERSRASLLGRLKLAWKQQWSSPAPHRRRT